MAWGVDDGDVVLGGLELPEGDIDGDTSFSLGLQFVQNPGVFERTFTHLEYKLFQVSIAHSYTVAFSTSTCCFSSCNLIVAARLISDLPLGPREAFYYQNQAHTGTRI